jgi:hypothetical protein
MEREKLCGEGKRKKKVNKMEVVEDRVHKKLRKK